MDVICEIASASTRLQGVRAGRLGSQETSEQRLAPVKSFDSSCRVCKAFSPIVMGTGKVVMLQTDPLDNSASASLLSTQQQIGEHGFAYQAGGIYKYFTAE